MTAQLESTEPSASGRPPTSPMSIGLVSQEYPPHTARGGIGTQTFLKAHGLSRLGHKVRVVSRSPDQHTHDYMDGNVRVIRVPGMDHRFSIYTTPADWVTYSAAVAAALADAHESQPFDLIDFPEWGCEGFVHLLNRSQWNTVPAVIHLHGPLVMFGHAIGWPELDSEFFRVGTAMEAATLRMADRVFSSSDCSAEWVASHYKLQRQAIPTIHTGIDVDHFRPAPDRSNSRPTIVFVGNISMNKGIGTLADAAMELAAHVPNLLVRLIGGGRLDTVTQLQQRAFEAGYTELFEYVGFVDRSDLPKHLSAADIFAAPSVYEGGPGFVYLEASACGLPVVACSGSGSSEAVIDGVTGILVPPNDAASLARSLRELLENRELRIRMGTAGRQHVLAHAESRSCLKQIEVFYSEVAQAAKGATR